MMKNKTLVIFDGNHLAYRAYYKFTNLRTLDDFKTSLIYGMPFIAESLIRRLSPNEVVVAFDGTRSLYRLGILPNYKNREKKLGFDAENFHKQKDIGRELFMALGLKIVYDKDEEADDIIAMVARRYSIKGWNVIIASGDKDFNQLIIDKDKGQGSITVYNPSKGKNKIYDSYNLFKEVGYHPRDTVDYLSLLGDASDKIPGFPGIGDKRARQLIDTFGGVKEFLKSDEKFGKVNKKELEEIWKRNKKLIDLKFFYRKFFMKKSIPWVNHDAKFNQEKFKKLCGLYEINSFLKPQFLNTFKKIKL